MRATVGWKTVKLTVGDITQQPADAIVNCANRRLIGGSGVDGAIHRAAGPAVMKETKLKYPNGCPVGSAVLSHAGFLPAQFVIHAVGPQWQLGEAEEDKLLRSAYLKCLELASEMSCVSISFPAISTGQYHYPIPEAAIVALEAIRDYEHPSQLPNDIRIVLHTSEILKQFEQAMKKTKGYDIEI